MTEQSSQIETFLAQMNGTIEALVLAFGGLVATHSEPEKPMALLQGMLDATRPEKGKVLSPSQAAYFAGTAAAVSKLAAAAKLARDVQAMNRSGTKQ